MNGCNYQVGYDLIRTDQAGGYHTLRVYGVLNVTNDYIAWTRGTARVWDNTVGIGTYYGRGSYTLVSKDIDVYCDSAGNSSVYVGGSLDTTFVSSGEVGSTAYLPNIPRAASIKSFAGTSLTNSFNATFDSKSGYNYKLRISVPHVVELQKFSNYSSGTNVKLSDSAVIEAKKHAVNGKVSIGGVIETYSGSTKIGESSEIILSIKSGNTIRLGINGQWKEATIYLGINGQWKEVTPYIGVNGQWKEGI